MESSSPINRKSEHTNLSTDGRVQQKQTSKKEIFLPCHKAVADENSTGNGVPNQSVQPKGNGVELVSDNIAQSYQDIPPTEEEIKFSELTVHDRLAMHEALDGESVMDTSEESLTHHSLVVSSYVHQWVSSDLKTEEDNRITLSWLKKHHPELVEEFEYGDLAIA